MAFPVGLTKPATSLKIEIPQCQPRGLRREYAWLDLREHCPKQRVRSEIRSIGPAHRAKLVYPNLGEQKRIPKGFKDQPKSLAERSTSPLLPSSKQHAKTVSLCGAHPNDPTHSSTPAVR